MTEVQDPRPFSYKNKKTAEPYKVLTKELG